MPVTFQPPQRLPWMDDAACVGAPVDLWFPEPAGTLRSHKREAAAVDAIAVCAACPVRQACLDHALDLGATVEGIWGGTTHDERRQLLRQAANRSRYERAKARRSA